MLPDNLHWLRDLLVFAAPMVTVIAAVMWAFCIAWAYKKVAQFQLAGAIREAEQVCADYESDPNSTAEEKGNARSALSDLRAMKMDIITGHVKDVRAKLTKMREG